MMNELKIFKNDEFGEVRTILIGAEPYFVGKDVAEILRYERTTKAIRDHVDEDDIREVPIQDSIGRMQNTPIINESGLYSLIMSSKMPNARKFKRWVTSEVLPSIRRHGMYATDELIANPDFAIAAFQALKQERERVKELNQTVSVQQQQISEMTQKASYYDVVLNCKDLVAISTIAKDYGWSAKRLNDYLHDKGVQFRQGKIWILYQKYAEKGYTSTRTHTYIDDEGTHTKVHTYWTQKGRLFIYELLKQDGICPLVERSGAN